jgi:hypothetical protein
MALSELTVLREKNGRDQKEAVRKSMSREA